MAAFTFKRDLQKVGCSKKGAGADCEGTDRFAGPVVTPLVSSTFMVFSRGLKAYCFGVVESKIKFRAKLKIFKIEKILDSPLARFFRFFKFSTLHLT